MTEAVEPTNYQDFLDGQAAEFGEGDLDTEEVLEGVEQADDTGADEQEAPARRGKREGTDVVLRRLEASDPGAAATMREMQRRMSRNINEWHDLRSEVLGLREELLAQREGKVQEQESEEQPKVELPEGVTDDHLELFRKMADHLGYVPKEELERRDLESTSAGYVQQELQRGVELYGDAFGVVEEGGDILLHPDVQARLRARLASLQDPSRGITPLDLFRLEFPEIAGARAGGVGAQPQRQRPATQRRQAQAGVIRRTAGGRAPMAIYDPKRNDSSEDVFDRAFALARRELTT